MMLNSNYDNRLAGVGVGVGAKVDAAHDNIIICKHECKLKRPNMFKKHQFDLDKLFRLGGQTHLLTCSVLTECSF